MSGTRAAAVLSLMLIGCGSSSSEATDTQSEVRIGLLLPYTGKDGSAGANYERGVLMAVDQVNAVGGLYQRPVRIVFADTHSSVERGVSEAQKLLDEGVVAIIGPESDELAQALPPVLGPRGVSLVTPSSTSVAVGEELTSELWFRLAPSARDLGVALGREIKSEHVQNVVIVSTETEYEESFAGAVGARLLESGLNLQAFVTISTTASDFTDSIDDIVQRQPEAVVLAADASTGSRFVNDFNFRAGGLKVKWFLSPSLEQPGFLLNADSDQVEGMIGVAAAVSPDPVRTDAFTAAFAERWNGATPTTGAFYYYDALALFAVAFEGAATATNSHTPDAATLSEFMLSASGQSGLVVEWDELGDGITSAQEGQAIYYSGLTGVISLDSSGGRSTVYTRFWTIKEGQIEPFP